MTSFAFENNYYEYVILPLISIKISIKTICKKVIFLENSTDDNYLADDCKIPNLTDFLIDWSVTNDTSLHQIFTIHLVFK